MDIQPWKRIEPTIKTKIDYQEMTIKTFELPNGNLATRAIFSADTARIAAVIAITADNKVIVGQQFRPGPEKVLIELPGGGVNENEAPEAAARREMLEETGYEPGQMTLLGVFPKDAYANGEGYYYLATDCRLVQSQALDHDEFIDVELMSIEAFLENAKRGNMIDLFAVLAAYDKLKAMAE